MRIRCIKPEFWADELVASWPMESRLAYIALWNQADDVGRLRANTVYLKSSLFPYDDQLDMAKVLVPIISAGKLHLYDVHGQTYGYLPRFKDHQVINRPSASRLPAPPATTGKQSSTDDSMSIHGTITEDSQEERNGKGKGKWKGNGKDNAALAPGVEIPEELNSPAFQTAWADYQQHRSEIGKRLKPTGAKRLLTQLAGWGEADAIEALRASVCNSWAGVFHPKEKNGNRRDTSDADHRRGF